MKSELLENETLELELLVKDVKNLDYKNALLLTQWVVLQAIIGALGFAFGINQVITTLLWFAGVSTSDLYIVSQLLLLLEIVLFVTLSVFFKRSLNNKEG